MLRTLRTHALRKRLLTRELTHTCVSTAGQSLRSRCVLRTEVAFDGSHSSLLLRCDLPMRFKTICLRCIAGCAFGSLFLWGPISCELE
jgi:hypothetical protein